MGILDFIFALIVAILLFVFSVGALGIKYEMRKLERENEELKTQRDKERVKFAKKLKKVVKEDK